MPEIVRKLCPLAELVPIMEGVAGIGEELGMNVRGRGQDTRTRVEAGGNPGFGTGCTTVPYLVFGVRFTNIFLLLLGVTS